MIKSNNLYKYCSNSPINKIDILGLLTMIIHGTFAAGSVWYRDKGFFAQAVDKYTKDVCKIKGQRIPYFVWSGGNSDFERIQGGENLSTTIENVMRNCPNEKINIIAHSHGGNVTLTALSELNKKNLKVNNVVLIATPHFKIKLKNGNSEFLYAQKSAISAIEGKLYNIYSREDLIQTTLADAKDGVPTAAAKRIGEPVWGDFLEVERTIGGKSINIEIKTNTGPYDAHGALHNYDMGKFIGQLLTGSIDNSAIESNKPKINNNDYKAYDRYENDIKEREYYKFIENMSKKN